MKRIMKPAIIALALALIACGPQQKKTSAAEAEEQLRRAATEVVMIERQMTSEKSPGVASLLTEQLRESKDKLANLSKAHAGQINVEAIVSDAQHSARMAILQESMHAMKDDERSRQDAAGARLEAARKAAQEQNDSETR